MVDQRELQKIADGVVETVGIVDSGDFLERCSGDGFRLQRQDEQDLFLIVVPQQIPAVVEAILQDGDVCIQAQFVQHLGDGVAEDGDLSLHPQEGERQSARQLHQIFVLVLRQMDVLLLGVPFEQGIALFKG